MRRPAAAAGSAVFFLVGPGIVVGLIPWWLTGWQVGEPVPYWARMRVLGTILLVAGLITLIQAFVRFVVEGLGTPAPIAAPGRLVFGGLYRYIRNPMYVAILSAFVGQALLLGQLSLLLCAAAMWLISVAFVRWYEEPNLGRRFGSDYDAYRRTVPAWWPRPWNPSETNQTHGDAPNETVWSYSSLLLFINCLEDPCSRKPDCRSANPRDGGRR